MKEHLDKLGVKFNFYKVVKRLILLIIITSLFLLSKTLKLSDDGYNIKENEYINIKTVVDGVLNIVYNSDNKNDRCVIYIVNEDTENKTRYKYILEPNKNYIITLTEGNGTYSIETVAVVDDKIYYGENLDIVLNNTSKYIYKISTSEVNYNRALNEIKSEFKDINDIDEIALNISKFSYDRTFAYNVKTGNIKTYTPDIRRFLNERKGICLDAATTLTAIYRYKGYDAQLVYGYIGDNDEYHSWVRVLYNDEWITFDPTLHKSGRVEDVERYTITEYH